MLTSPARRQATKAQPHLLNARKTRPFIKLHGYSLTVWLVQNMARAVMPFFCVCFALLGVAGCASSPQRPDVLKDAPSSSDVFEPVVMLVLANPQIGVEIQADPQEAAPESVLPIQLSQPTTSLWERIRRGFGMPNLDNRLVDESAQWYAKRPDYLKRMTLRSQKYLFHVVEELERRHMPTELALLPFVESAFNPQAVSSAKAAGMWQFIPSTGLTYDLKQNTFRDDRRDVLASTRAALDYLQKLHGMFRDWQLALAAYNWGEGSVERAITRNKRLGLGTRYADLRMPKETQSYVPKLQAVKNMVVDPQACGVQLPEINNQPYFQSVTLSRDIDVALAARLAGITHDDFKALNPSANRAVILAAGTPQILVPWDNADLFQRNLQAHHGRQLASWTAWVVPTTMTPTMAANRVGMAESELRSVNTIPAGRSAKAGSTLVIKRKATIIADVSGSVADTAQLVLVNTPRQVQRRGKTKGAPAALGKKHQASPRNRSKSTA